MITSDRVSLFNESAFMVKAKKKTFTLKSLCNVNEKKIPLACIEFDWRANFVVICKCHRYAIAFSIQLADTGIMSMTKRYRKY